MPVRCKLWCGKRNFLHPSAGGAALWCLSNRESAYPCRRHGLGPWVGKIPWMRNSKHSSVLAWRTPWTEEPGGLQSMGSHSKARTLSPQSCPTLCDPMVSRPPAALSTGLSRQEHWSGSPVPFPYGMLESKSKKLLRRARLSVTPWTAAYQAPLSMEFSRQEHWSRLPFASPKVRKDLATEQQQNEEFRRRTSL